MLTACKKSDTKLSQQVPGTWTRDSSDILVIDSDGSWSIKPSSGSPKNIYAGTWHIKGGILIMTMTNASSNGFAKSRILRVDDHQLVYQDILGGNIQTNSR